MHHRLLTRRDVVAWVAGFLLVAGWIVASGFTSEDPDSALYAALSERLAAGDPSAWVAPEWWGYWDSEGLFVEHPVGVLLLPAMLGAAGLPAVQAAYVVGIATGLASLLLVGGLVARIATPADGRLALVLLQWMPVAFIFRIRANHEYPMLVCLLVTLVALDGVRRSWWWLPVPAMALAAALLIKGVFVVLALLAAGLWILINPLDAPGSARRAVLAGLVALGAMAATAIGYDRWYLDATGQTFWGPYWNRQLAPLELAGSGGTGSSVVGHLGFYLLRLLWHPAPWSLALLAAAWRWRSTLVARWRALPVAPRRGLAFAVSFAALQVLMLSPASRFAERYVFSATWALGAAGVVVALEVWPTLRSRIERIDAAVPALPAVCWTTLMALRLLVGAHLPRIMG